MLKQVCPLLFIVVLPPPPDDDVYDDIPDSNPNPIR